MEEEKFDEIASEDLNEATSGEPTVGVDESVVTGIHETEWKEPEVDVAEGEFDPSLEAEGTTPSYNPASTDDRSMFVAPGPGSHPDSDIHDYLATEYNDGHPGFSPPKY